jgi:DNA polymerase-3 subunit alpha
LLGFYVTGHPLDKFRGVIDSEKFNKLGALDSLDINNPRERFPFAGMIRTVEGKTTKAGKPFGVITIEDFTGSAEVLLWGESFVPARDSGLLVPGNVIRMRAAVQVDDRTQARKLTGYEVGELKVRKAAVNGNGPVELTLWTARHSERDLEDIRMILSAHPGATPVLLHFNSSAGRRVTVEAGQSFRVKRGDALDRALGKWIED